MKIHLLSAPSLRKARLAELSEGIYPPLGILHIASSIRQEFPEIKLKVSDGLLLGYERTLQEIKSFAPDILFVSFCTPEATGAYQLVNTLKESHPKLLVVIGGVHPTALPLEVMEKTQADIVVLGEGEKTSREIVKYFLNKTEINNINGVYYRENGTLFKTQPPTFIQNLDIIPFPARDLIDLHQYKGWFICQQTPEINVIWSRGCPFNCTFCSNPVWRTASPLLRLRSPENIVKEMEELYKNFGIREVFDHSDEFNNNIAHAKEICNLIIERRLRISWKVQLRAYPLPEELVKLMRRAGCWYVQLGIESGNEKTLRGIGKKINLQQVVEACRLLKKYGIKVFGLFMLFNVWEDENKLYFEDIEMTKKTLEFAERLVNGKLLNWISWMITTPYPGSLLYEIALKYNLIKEELIGRWENWLREDSFILSLPKIALKDQVKLYSLGSLLRAKCYLRSGGFGFKDIGFMLKKTFKVFQLEINSRLGK